MIIFANEKDWEIEKNSKKIEVIKLLVTLVSDNKSLIAIIAGT